jgi:uncharacterized metal-binding protein YceD (DUF177 family)
MLVKIEEIQDPGLTLEQPIERRVLESALLDSEGFRLVSSTPLKAFFHKVSGQVHVKGAFTASVLCPCLRCTREVTVEVPVTFSLRMIRDVPKEPKEDSSRGADASRGERPTSRGRGADKLGAQKLGAQNLEAQNPGAQNPGAQNPGAQNPGARKPGSGAGGVDGRRGRRPIHGAPQSPAVRGLPEDDEAADFAASFELDEVDAEPFDGKTIELDPIIREQVLLALPVTVLCREGCKGLCSTCGQDLNEQECGHSASKHIDVRLAKLKDIKLKN